MPSIRVNGRDFGMSPNGLSIVELTQEEYDALPDSKYTDGILYHITDGDELSAKNIACTDAEGNNSTVQDELDSLNVRVPNSLRLGKEVNTETGEIIVGHYEFDEEAGTDVLVPFKSGGPTLYTVDAVGIYGTKSNVYTLPTLNSKSTILARFRVKVNNSSWGSYYFKQFISFAISNGVLFQSRSDIDGYTADFTFIILDVVGDFSFTINNTATHTNLEIPIPSFDFVIMKQE